MLIAYLVEKIGSIFLSNPQKCDYSVFYTKLIEVVFLILEE